MADRDIAYFAEKYWGVDHWNEDYWFGYLDHDLALALNSESGFSPNADAIATISAISLAAEADLEFAVAMDTVLQETLNAVASVALVPGTASYHAFSVEAISSLATAIDMAVDRGIEIGLIGSISASMVSGMIANLRTDTQAYEEFKLNFGYYVDVDLALEALIAAIESTVWLGLAEITAYDRPLNILRVSDARETSVDILEIPLTTVTIRDARR